MRIITTGGRRYNDGNTVYRVLAEYCRGPVTILHGGAPGADSLVEQEAERLGYEVKVFPAAWKMLGKAAGPARNQRMIDSTADLLIAFPGGRGTADCIRRARKAGIPVRLVE